MSFPSRKKGISILGKRENGFYKIETSQIKKKFYKKITEILPRSRIIFLFFMVGDPYRIVRV
jgi:hypothetical protein